MKKHYNIKITGRVQRIGFRFQAMEKAYKYGISGFVINRDDESVYIEAEGEQQNMEQFVAWCKSGPLGSRVENVTVEEGELKGYSSFEIQRRSRPPDSL